EEDALAAVALDKDLTFRYQTGGAVERPRREDRLPIAVAQPVGKSVAGDRASHRRNNQRPHFQGSRRNQGGDSDDENRAWHDRSEERNRLGQGEQRNEAVSETRARRDDLDECRKGGHLSV